MNTELPITVSVIGVINVIGVVIYWMVILSEVSINLDPTHQIP